MSGFYKLYTFQVTFEAMKRLREHGLTPDNIARTPAGELEEILKPVGFYKASQD